MRAREAEASDMQKILGDLVLSKDTKFREGIEVEGNIVGEYDLTVFGDIEADNIKANNIEAHNIKAHDVKAWDIKARDIAAWDFVAYNIKALDIEVWDIDAHDIEARNIKARDIKARDIKANNIEAHDIDAHDIDALDINFHAFCIVHASIHCSSIAGRRENAFHRTLDGVVIIREGEERL